LKSLYRAQTLLFLAINFVALKPITLRSFDIVILSFDERSINISYLLTPSSTVSRIATLLILRIE
jgi:hypothetical protein